MLNDTPLPPVDELVTLIYQGPLEDRPWISFLNALSRRLDCLGAAITLRVSRKGQPPLIIWGGEPPSISEEHDRQIQYVHAELAHLDPLRNALRKRGDIFTLDEVTTREALEENPFYQKVMKPYGLEYELGMFLSEPGGWECHMGLVNDAARGDFGQREKQMLSDLRPHLERALELFSRIHRNETELQALSDTLGRLTIATFIVNGAGHIIHANRAAQLLAETSLDVRMVDGRLKLARGSDDAALQKLILTAAQESGKGAPFVEAIRIGSPPERHLGLLVRSIDAPTRYRSDVSPAVLVYATGHGSEMPTERLVATLFDLTPSEAHLATLLANGLTLAEAARRLDLTENTVRSYSKAIFSKTGVRRQTDLVRLILRSVAVLG